jgi:hypothetical protein
MDLGGPVHQVRFLSWPFVEDFAVGGMPGLDVALLRLLGPAPDGRAQQKSGKNEPTNGPAAHGKLLGGASTESAGNPGWVFHHLGGEPPRVQWKCGTGHFPV